MQPSWSEPALATALRGNDRRQDNGSRFNSNTVEITTTADRPWTWSLVPTLRRGNALFDAPRRFLLMSRLATDGTQSVQHACSHAERGNKECHEPFRLFTSNSMVLGLTGHGENAPLLDLGIGSARFRGRSHFRRTLGPLLFLTNILCTLGEIVPSPSGQQGVIQPCT